MIQAKIEALLKDKIGLAASIIGSNKIARAVEKRRLVCDLPDLPSYLQRLQTSTQELEELIEHVIVPETWFFRDRKPFTFLQNYVKSEWLPSQNHGILRLLSVPCSSGEEPYSIAMLLLDAGLTPKQFRIDAVDISKKAILTAQRAVYSKNSFRGDNLPEKERYFQQKADGYQLSELVRNTVNFTQGNLLNPFFLNHKKYHIIFCRNLLIYFEPSACAKTIDILYRLLIPKGLLFVGAAETSRIPTNQFVSVRHPFSFAYQKIAPTEQKSKEIQLPNSRQEQEVKSQKITNSQQPITNNQQPQVLIKSPIQSRESLMPETQTPIPPNLQTATELANRGDLNEAASLCKTYLNHNPTNAQAYLLLGEVYQAWGDNEQAEQYFQKAIYLKPNHYEALIHLALLKEHRGDLAAAAVLRQRIQRL